MTSWLIIYYYPSFSSITCNPSLAHWRILWWIWTINCNKTAHDYSMLKYRYNKNNNENGTGFRFWFTILHAHFTFTKTQGLIWRMIVLLQQYFLTRILELLESHFQLQSFNCFEHVTITKMHLNNNSFANC